MNESSDCWVGIAGGQGDAGASGMDGRKECKNNKRNLNGNQTFQRQVTSGRREDEWSGEGINYNIKDNGRFNVGQVESCNNNLNWNLKY